MRIAVTGATGFIGRYIVRHLASLGHDCRCWFRPESDRTGFDDVAPARLAWLAGELGDRLSTSELVAGCDAVVHAALYHPGGGFRGGEGEILEFAERNVRGTPSVNAIETLYTHNAAVSFSPTTQLQISPQARSYLQRWMQQGPCDSGIR